ncbi:hypothetical protein SCHPADRAFT_890563 [Schizopora paradoxa]|uniref:Uncharacterized protein n=1 Tax=Schizopora paradoxa TaxID=27342 RepID=A0A0H2RMF3_9AGAM|nr:hypothetical protein SCHPADRAFT_890563 [Schizopora paradoxa]
MTSRHATRTHHTTSSRAPPSRHSSATRHPHVPAHAMLLERPPSIGLATQVFATRHAHVIPSRIATSTRTLWFFLRSRGHSTAVLSSKSRLAALLLVRESFDAARRLAACILRLARHILASLSARLTTGSSRIAGPHRTSRCLVACLIPNKVGMRMTIGEGDIVLQIEITGHSRISGPHRTSWGPDRRILAGINLTFMIKHRHLEVRRGNGDGEVESRQWEECDECAVGVYEKQNACWRVLPERAKAVLGSRQIHLHGWWLQAVEGIHQGTYKNGQLQTALKPKIDSPSCAG